MKSYFELLEAISGRRLETGGVDGEREAASLAEGVSSGDSRMADPALIATMTATSMSRKAKAKDGRLIPAATSARPAAAADRRWKVSERMAASRPRASTTPWAPCGLL